jgi:hypothetical protein
MVVQATVDGRPIPMAIDLGAGINVLSQSAGGSLVAVTGKYVTLRLTGQRVDLPTGNVVSIALGEFKIDDHLMGLWKGLDNGPVSGLISARAFKNVAATFDYKNHDIVMEDQVSYPERKRFASRVGVTLLEDFGLGVGAFAKFDFGNGKSGMCEIDVGEPGISIDNHFAGALGVKLTGDNTQTTLKTIGLVGASDSTMHDVPVTFTDLVYDCNVGDAFWAGRTFTLDIPSRVMWVAPPA